MERSSSARADPVTPAHQGWRADARLVAFVRERLERRLTNYQNIPDEVRDHYETEIEALAGGYSYRQVLELVQNAADAILENATSANTASGRIVLRLAGNRLYAANTGAPLSHDGIIALLSARSSPKRKNQIGRFGIGFKSLLGLGGAIDVFSRSICLRFDPALCGKTIRERLALPPDHPAPGLRLAWPIESDSEFRADSVLHEMSHWAITIVRADIAEERLVAHVRDELGAFPGEFLLFLPVDVDLELQSGSSTNRKIGRKRTGHSVNLVENGAESPWQVVDIHVPLTDPEARTDATTVHTRDEVPIAWALPLSAREERAGRFWAFFPTDTPSRVPGFLNAPWKVNSDRTALIHGPYNSFLMENAAKLVVSALAPLATIEDPGRPLDMFPRELETREETAQPLVDAVWDHLATAQVVPNGKGELQAAANLKLHPIEDDAAVRQWWHAAAPELRAEFVHPNCYQGQRINRLKVLLRRNKKDDDHLALATWLESVASIDIAQTRVVFQLLKRIFDGTRDYTVRNELRRAKLIPTEHGNLVAASDAVICSGTVPAGKSAVHHAVVADKECSRILEQVLGVRPLDESQWQALLNQALLKAEQSWGQMTDQAWANVWDGLRNAPETVSLKFLTSSAARIRARSRRGQWELATHLLRLGPIVADHENLAGVLLDEQYHANDEHLLAPLHIEAEPPNGFIAWHSSVGDAYQQYRQFVRPHYSEFLSAKNKSPQWSYLDFVGDSRVLAGTPFLCALPLAARGNLTTLLLNRLGRQALQHALFGHTTRPEVYEPIEVPSPTCWLLARYGAVTIDGHNVTIHDLYAARSMEWLQRLPGWSAIIARVGVLISGFFEQWTIAEGDLKTIWPAAFASCKSTEVPAELRRTCFEAGAEHGQVPAQVRIRGELVPLDRCYATSSDVLAAQVQKAGVPVVVLTTETIRLWSTRGAKNLASVARIEHDGPVAEPVSLLDVAPELAPALVEEVRKKAWVHARENLHIQIGEIQTPLPATFEAGMFLVDLDQLARRSWQDRLMILLHEAINAGWISGDPEHIASDIVQRNYVRRRAEIAAKPSLEERLLAAVGGSPVVFVETFDDAVRRAVELKAAMQPLAVARLALAMHGPTVLAVLQEQLEKEGLEPPRRWGTQDAFDFAMAIGFAPEFGGSRTARRSAEIWASGPMPLGVLHDYQERLIGQLAQLVAQHKTKPARAVLGLPTGSGKTRVAVEMAVDCALHNGASVLWVAQTDELCEQAVQSFRQVWANRGQPWTDLRIFRLWGGNPNPGAADTNLPTVIVASIQTLASRISTTLPDWIRDASLVVIDEAHHAIAPSYTRLLGWLIGKQTDERKTVPPPLLGLTATPFRGRNEEESHRLARRFGGQLYPAPDEQAELYAKLQAAGILSEILIEPLTYARPFVLTDAEKKQIETFDEFPDAAAHRMGEDERRNEAIVCAVGKYATSGQVLLFANSVWHASHLAALLQLRGVPAASVHGGTETSARQYFVRQFQSGTLKVLCNYGVLTTGFDAPKTDAIVISRPVFSPVRYMQMVGRGLRGEKNGGTATCRVVTVLDNIVEYSDRLAYHTYFTPYFQSSGGG